MSDPIYFDPTLPLPPRVIDASKNLVEVVPDHITDAASVVDATGIPAAPEFSVSVPVVHVVPVDAVE